MTSARVRLYDFGTAKFRSAAPISLRKSTVVIAPGGANRTNALLQPGKEPSGPNMNDGNPFLTPIGANAALIPAKLQEALAASNDLIVGDDIGITKSYSDPIKTITYTAPASVQSVRIPPYLSHSGSYNSISVFLTPDNNSVWQGQPTTLSPGGNATATYPWPQYEPVSIRGTDPRGQHGGSHLSGLYGTIRTWEFDAAATDEYVIQHALCINLYARKYLRGGLQGETIGFRWPATAADGYWNNPASADRYGSSPVSGGPAVGLLMGALLTLPTDFNFATVTNVRARAVARALWGFGGYVVDDTAWDVHAVSIEKDRMNAWESVSGDGRAMHDQLRAVFNQLQVVNNNTATSIGGGGAFRVPAPGPLVET